MNLTELKNCSTEELHDRANAAGLSFGGATDKSQLILEILRSHAQEGGSVSSSGTLEILGDGFGFLRDSRSNFTPSPQDIYVSPSQIRRFHLNTGDFVAGQVRPPKESERYFALLRVETINSDAADKAMTSQGFSERTAIGSTERLSLAPISKTARMFEILCPMGKGQRVLLLAPPRTHGDSLLLSLAKAAAQNKNEYDLTTLVIAQRPEFVTEYEESRPGKFVSSVFDEAVQKHSQVTDVVIETAKRAAVQGQDILLIVDSLTRLATTASQAFPGNGITLPGGLSARGVQGARRIFAAGRNLKGAGSITVLALLRDSNSPVDTYLRQELLDMANACVQLSPAASAAGCTLPLAPQGSYNDDENHFCSEQEREETKEARASLQRAEKSAPEYHRVLRDLE